ncbi:hypothetical protein QUF90_23580 [Desulfococcaceae bacterium HSG9]|nr:hypothetical protein [Desulfococcaceae bacterium HSG9]
MRYTKKLAVLKKIYKVYDSLADSWPSACRRYCDTCCTCNVTMTTLEGALIAEKLADKGKTDLFDRLNAVTDNRRFLPKITTNELAERCVQGKAIPDEENGPLQGKCPLLIDNQCPLYSVRPFGCRCFISTTECKVNGYADVNPFVISVNNLFLQYIEHIDSDGFFGNMTDILVFINTMANRQDISANTMKQAPKRLIVNKPLKVVLTPPEHREKIKPVLNALLQIQGDYQ